MSEPFPAPDPVAESKSFNAVRKTVVVVVEGAFDRDFWSMHLTRRCRINVQQGRGKAIGLLDAQTQSPKAVFLGILDADWDRLEDALAEREDVVWTDARDLEATLLSLPVLEKLLRRYDRRGLETFEAQWGETFRERLMRHALEIGRLRWLRRQAEHIDDLRELKFQKPSRKGRGVLTRPNYERCTDKGWTPSSEAMITQVIEFSGAHGLRQRDLVSECAELEERDAALLCNGHDLMGFLAAGFAAILQENAVADLWAERISIGCERAWLETTQMWQAIRAWEAAHPGYEVLAA